MPRPPLDSRPDFRQHLEVETPEQVVLDYEIAGLGSRALAAILDLAILGAWGLGLLIVTVVAAGAVTAENWFFAAYGLLWFASAWGYFVFFEGLRGGQTPGKRRLGIRVVLDTGHPVSVGAAALRNLVRPADFIPPPYLLGAILVGVHPRGKRLGDLVAGTVVVRDRPSEAVARGVVTTATLPADTGPPVLSEEEFQLLTGYLARAASLEPAVRSRLANQLIKRFEDRLPAGGPGDPVVWLAEARNLELSRRRSERDGTTWAAPRRGRGDPAERLASRQQPRWAQFEQIALRVSREGLDGLGAAELPDFAARYREVAADLARARTYRAPPPLLHRLERLVAAGHNALYRAQRTSLRQVWLFLVRDCPAAIIEARRAIGLAFLAFFLPAAGGFMLIRESPALAPDLLPEIVLERAQAGQARQQQGRGYFEASPESRPMIASAIMANNVTVAFACFAGGAFAGIGSVVLLAFNGLSIGATAGHFANAGLLGYLAAFIIGHGVLELFAIWVAGAAGLMLGLAMVAPGDLTRADALRERGALAIRLVGAVVLLLVIAGTIEGFVSAGTGPLALRVGVSVASLVFLLGYLSGGIRTGRTAPDR